ncbi:MAG: NAD-binding protein, partial [Acidimicrobiaceae bacterium]|nr:NAD-binding protein [Acidimicrobiaceae bacterium]
MHVIVVGAGEVGSYVAARLSHERHNVAVVDTSADRLRQLSAELDVLTVEGSGTHPSILTDAGLDSCELVVAVTSKDEVNLVASLIAKQHGVDKTIVRIESEELRSRASAELRQAFGADLVIDPDRQTAERILNLLDYPGASEIAVMAQGEAIVIGTRLEADAPIVGRRLSEMAAEYEPDWEFMVGSISRGEDTYIPRADYMLLEDDLVRVVCKRRARHRVARLLGLGTGAIRHVLLL